MHQIGNIKSPQHYQMCHQTKAKISGQLVDLYRWRNSELRAVCVNLNRIVLGVSLRLFGCFTFPGFEP